MNMSHQKSNIAALHADLVIFKKAAMIDSEFKPLWVNED